MTFSNIIKTLSINESSLFSQLSEDERAWRSLRGHIITIEGLIGVGKSTAGRSIVRFLNNKGLKAHFCPEFFHQPLLELYLENMVKEAWSFQSIMIRERINIYKEAQRMAEQGMVVFIDRSIIGDMAFALMQREKGFIDDKQWKVYLSLISREKLIEPSMTIYLECSPAEAYRRMKERSIGVEVSGYSLEYFQNLADSYQEVIDQTSTRLFRMSWEEPLSLVDGNHLSDKTCREVITEITQNIL